MTRTYLGIDLGTSSVKVILIDDSKNVIAQCDREYELSHPQVGWSEIDPRVWYDCMVECLRKVLSGQDAQAVQTIGVTGQMHTLVVLGEDGEPVCPALMWNDKRTKELIPEMKQIMKTFEEGDYLSSIVSTGSPAANLYWLKKERPEILAACRHFMIGPDYLVYCLTGCYGTDYCEASTSSLYQLREKKWSEQMRDFLGISAEIYPEIHGSAECVGVVLADIATQLGLSDDVKVIPGTGDNPATAISTGCLGQGYPVLSLGTSGVLMVPVKSMDDVKKGKVILCSADAEEFKYLIQGVVQSTGDSISWWAKKILDLSDFGELNKKMDKERAAKSSLIFYPHLSGDKTIYADAELRGAFMGLSTDTTKEEMSYAILEGLCLAFKQLSEEMKLSFDGVSGLKVVGGGSKNDMWMQLMANVLNVRTERMEGMIGPAFGIALLAWGTQHGGAMGELTQDCLSIRNRFDPEPGLVEVYRDKYEKYLRIHDAMKYIENGKLIM